MEGEGGGWEVRFERYFGAEGVGGAEGLERESMKARRSSSASSSGVGSRIGGGLEVEREDSVVEDGGSGDGSRGSSGIMWLCEGALEVIGGFGVLHNQPMSANGVNQIFLSLPRLWTIGLHRLKLLAERLIPPGRPVSSLSKVGSWLTEKMGDFAKTLLV